MKIKTIIEHTPEEFDKSVNDFEASQWDAKKGINRVSFTQTHYSQLEGCRPEFIAVIFYREAKE